MTIEEALEDTIVAVGQLLFAVKQMNPANVIPGMEYDVAPKQRKPKEYHVDLWEVGPYYQQRYEKKVRIKGYVAKPKKHAVS